MRWPFMLASTHTAILDAFLGQRDILAVELAKAHDRANLAEARVVELLTPAPPAAKGTPAPPRMPQPSKPSADLSTVDPDDTASMAKIALREMGPGRHSATALQRRIESLRQQIISAHDAAHERSLTPATAPAGPPPPDIQKSIEAAIAQGKALAQHNAEAS